MKIYFINHAYFIVLLCEVNAFFVHAVQQPEKKTKFHIKFFVQVKLDFKVKVQICKERTCPLSHFMRLDKGIVSKRVKVGFAYINCTENFFTLFKSQFHI